MKQQIAVAFVALTITLLSPSQALRLLSVGIRETQATLKLIDSKSNAIHGLCLNAITMMAKDSDFKIQFKPRAN